MSLSLEPDATRFFLSKSIVGNPNVKKAAARMADRVGAQFILYLDQLLSEVSKGKTVTPEDVVKVLQKHGFEDYVDAFKKGMEEEGDEGEEEDEEPKKKEREKKTKGKK